MPTRAFGLWTVLIGGLRTRGVGITVGNRPRVGSRVGDRKFGIPLMSGACSSMKARELSEMSVDVIWVRL
jgi:hypothetical protein